MERIQFGGQRVVGFGVGDIFLPPPHDSDEMQALIKVFDTRMGQLAESITTFGSKWMSIDPTAATEFLTDYALLQTRYALAKSKASNATGFWASLGDTEAVYTAIMKAVSQGYSPEKPEQATRMRGDWADLRDRLITAQKAAGAPVLVDRPPPDLANVQSSDLATKIYKALAPLDVIAQVTHEEAPKTEAMKGALDTFAWLQAHKTAIAIGATATAVVVVGGILYTVVRR